MKEQIQARMDEIKKAIEESAANHNGLLVRYSEAEHLLKMAEECCTKECEQAAEEILEGVIE